MSPRLPPYQRHSDTSRAASESIAEHAPTMRDRVFAYIRSQGAHGATRDEIEVALGMLMQTVNGRIAELKDPKQEGGPKIRETDEKRATRSGHLAHVFVAIGYAAGTQPQLFAVASPNRWRHP